MKYLSSTYTLVLDTSPVMVCLHYSLEGTIGMYYEGIGEQLIPEGHFQLYYSSDGNQGLHFEGEKSFSLLTIMFPALWLEPLKSQSRVARSFLYNVSHKICASLFKVPCQPSIENTRLLKNIIHGHWKEDGRRPVLQLILLSELKGIGQESSIARFLRIQRNSDPVYLAAEWILPHLEEPISTTNLSKKVLLNESKLKKDFKKVFGVPIFAFQRQARVEKAKQLLLETNYPVSKVARSVGFGNTAWLSDFFKRQTGSAPSVYRK